LSKKAVPLNFLRHFTHGETVWLKIVSAVAQSYSYNYNNFGPFI